MQSGGDDHIRQRAYELWEREGRPEGRHDAHWDQARRETEAGAGRGAAATGTDAGGLSEADTAGGGGAILPAARPGEGRAASRRATATPRRKPAKDE